MLRLVWKDIVAAKWILLAAVPLFAVQAATFAYFGPAFLLAAFLFAGLLAFGSIAMEEMQNTEILWNSLPLSRGDVVLGRYLSALVGILSGLGLSWTIGRTTVSLIPAVAAGRTPFAGLAAHAVLFVFLTLLAAFFLPFCFRYGAGPGSIRFAAAAVGTLLGVSLLLQAILFVKGYSSPIVDPEFWSQARPALQAKAAEWLERWGRQLLGVLVFFSLGALTFSALLSRRLYEMRDL